MPNHFHTLPTLCLSLFWLAQCSVSQASELDVWERQRQRLKQEAISLFQAILQESDSNPEQCEFQTKWDDYAVPSSIADKYLGVKVPADLSPSNPVGKPEEILDPGGTMRDAFCDKADDDLRLNILIESFKRGELTAETSPGGRPSWIDILRREYAFPIFDGSYRRAVVIRTSTRRFWYKRDGKVRGGLDTIGVASVYQKQKARWRLLKHESLFHGHG